jgi:hypothetical protein
MTHKTRALQCSCRNIGRVLHIIHHYAQQFVIALKYEAVYAAG